MADILTVIVSYNGMKWMDKCLDSVRRSSIASDIYVVDNGSTDGTREYLRSQADIVYVESSENLGFGAANNLGFKYALDGQYKYIYLLNQDAYVAADAMERLVAVLEADSSLGLVSPMQLQADWTSLDPYFARHCRAAVEGRDVAAVRFVMAAHWMLRREALETVGGFSPAFHHYGEDENWIDRLLYWGMRPAVVTAAKAVHDRGLRKRSKASALALKENGCVVRVSSPLKKPCYALQTLRLIGFALRRASFHPLRYIPAFLARKAELSALRSQSMVKGAFLER